MLMQGIVPSGIAINVIAWCIKMRGALFVAIFNPLQLLLVIISAYLLLDEKLYLGRYIINLHCHLLNVNKNKNKNNNLNFNVSNLNLKSDTLMSQLLFLFIFYFG